MTDILPHDEIAADSIAEDSLKAAEIDYREPKRTAGQRTKGILRNILIAIPLIGLVVWTIMPFLVTASVSLKDKTEVFADPSLIPADPSLRAYGDVLASESFSCLPTLGR